MGIITAGRRTRKQEPSEPVHMLRLRFLLKAKNITQLKKFPINWYKHELNRLFIGIDPYCLVKTRTPQVGWLHTGKFPWAQS